MAASSILEKLFGSQAKVRLMRLFLVNPDAVFDSKLITKRTGLASHLFSREIKALMAVGYIKRASRVITEPIKGGKFKRKKIQGSSLLREFPYLNELAQLLASATPGTREKLLGSSRGIGRVQLMVISGRLVNEDTRNVDLFIVGDALKRARIEKLLKGIEGDTGNEIVYALMPTQEFQYRYGLYDRFLKDLFDNPHEIILNKLGI